jgi:putative colanic acid biosysnthesis UDP-glucose lipid carrier transferase
MMMITTSFNEIQYFKEKKGIATESLSLRSFLDYKRNYFFFKRVGDITLSLGVIVLLLSWLIPILAVLIKLDSSGPVFFIQRRVGRWGRSFRCFKFRTMVVNDLANTEQARENDVRITRVGKFLRRSNLDEFPQFINVLLGHMSIVGPRPHMHADCDRFSKVITNYKFRSLVRPGITGLAQIKGYRGPTRDFASIFHRYQFDSFYVRNASFWLDMRIIRKTAAQTIRQLLGRLFPNKAEIPAKDWAPSVNGLRN